MLFMKELGKDIVLQHKMAGTSETAHITLEAVAQCKALLQCSQV